MGWNRGVTIGSDRFGNPLSASESTLNLALAVPITKAGSIASKALSGVSVKVVEKRTTNIVIRFGNTENQIYYTFRYTDALGLKRSLVQTSVERYFKGVSSQAVVGKPFNQIIKIKGVKIQYTAFKL